MTREQMLDALSGLIREAGRLHEVFLSDLRSWTPEFTTWLNASQSTVEAIFGSTSEALQSFRNIYFIPPPDQLGADGAGDGDSHLTWYDSGLRYAHSMLSGYRYSVDRLTLREPSRPSPYVFLAHGGPSRRHVEVVREFLRAIGLEGIIVEDMPNFNLSLNQKVLHYLGLCTSGIALATEEDETAAGEARTRPNVENEIGLMQAAPNIGSRIIYMKEPQVRFASNYSEKVWISFDRSHVEGAFIELARELRAFRLI